MRLIWLVMVFLLWALAMSAQIMPPLYINYQKTMYDPGNPSALLVNASFPAWVNI